MSLNIRPVVETWGEGISYSSRETDIWDMLEAIATQAFDGSDDISDGSAPAHIKDYDDLHVVWIENGASFLDYLTKTQPAVILDHIDGDITISDDEAEAARQLEDVTDLCRHAESWRKSIDPEDGSLRIYCD